MTFDQMAVFALVSAVFVFLIWGKFRYDVVAFGALIVAAVLGPVPTGEIFSGFGHPAVVITALVLIVSRGLSRSGAIDLLAHRVLDASRGLRAHIGIMAGLAAALSTAMNNVAALALLMPSFRPRACGEGLSVPDVDSPWSRWRCLQPAMVSRPSGEIQRRWIAPDTVDWT